MKQLLRRYGTLLGLIVLFITFSVLRPEVFPTTRNLTNVLEQISLLAIISVGATVVMVIGEFDLSVAAVASFAGIFTVRTMVNGVSMYWAIPFTLLLAMLFGAINGLLVSRMNILSFITTLSTGTFLTGITYWYSGGTIIFSGIPREFLVFGQGSVFGVRISVLIMAGVLFLFWYLFSETLLGRRLYAIGGNEKAAEYSGVPIHRNKVTAFALTSMLAAITGIVLASRLGSAHPTAGEGYLLRAYATVFLGMTLFKEGEPNIPGTFIGVLIMGILANGLTLLGVPIYFQNMLTGAIIIAALVFQTIKK